MESKIYGGEVPKDGWKADGRRKTNDVKEIMKHIAVRKNVSPEDPEKVLWRISRFKTTIMIIETDSSVARDEVMEQVRSLKLLGIKEAIEAKLDYKIPQDYLDEVGWEAD